MRDFEAGEGLPRTGEKRPYLKPTLREFGSVRKMTGSETILGRFEQKLWRSEQSEQPSEQVSPPSK
jgi:hypothetical protein